MPGTMEVLPREDVISYQQDMDPAQDITAKTDQDPAIGSRAYFADMFATLRRRKGATLEQWAGKAGCNKAVLSRLERGLYPLPSRDTLIKWSKAWNLSYNERCDLLFAAAYLPDLGSLEDSLSTYEKEVFKGAIRELVAGTDASSPYNPFSQAWNQVLLRLTGRNGP